MATEGVQPTAEEPMAQKDPLITPVPEAQPDSAAIAPAASAGKNPEQGAVAASDSAEVPHENGVQVPQDDAANPATTAEIPSQSQPVPAAPLTEFERQLQKAEADPTDFAQWVAVEKLLEKEGSIEKTRRVFDGFLAEFPLCYAYWKKYADAEHRHSSPEWAISVFDRGTAAVPYSCDLWGHYCTYLQKIGKPADEIRRHFEQGVAYVGSDYQAHVLWDKYIKFELEQGAFANVAHLYLQILSAPLKELPRYHSSFKTFASSRQVADLMSTDELSKIRDTLLQAKQLAGEEEKKAAAATLAKQLAEAATADKPVTAVAEGGKVEAAAATTETPATAVAEETASPAVPTGVEVSPEPAAVKLEVGAVGSGTKASEEVAKAEVAAAGQGEDAMEVDAPEAAVGVSDEEVKAFWLSGVAAVVEESTTELARRRVFEDAIKRPYFHVKPLPSSQLQAWDSYIDYILKKDDAGAIVRLFERCLVACANYPEFWVRYIRYQEKGGEAGVQGAKASLLRAQQVFCKSNIALQLFAARFQERTGDMAGARRTYGLLDTLAPGLVEAVVQAANFERRQGNLAGACKVFDDAIAREVSKEGISEDGATMAMFYARFLFLDCGDAPAARKVYARALEKWPGLLSLWEGALHFEEHCPGEGRTERVLHLYRRATAPGSTEATSALGDADRELLSGRMLDFADRHASPALAAELEASHAAAFPKQWGEAGGTKRAAEASPGGPPAKRAATDPLQGRAGQPTSLAAPAFPPAQPAAAGVSGAPPTGVAGYGYQDPAAAYAQPVASGPPPAAYYPPASAGYGYGYQYPYPQDYGYSYTGYQQ